MAAEWVDQELIDNIKLRNRLSKNWRFARKNDLAKEVQEESKRKYEHQKKTDSNYGWRKKRAIGKKKLKNHGKMVKNSGQ